MKIGSEFDDFDNSPDRELCSLAQAGDKTAEECLVRRYFKLVKSCARPYFLAGADGEDLMQEGMIGLLKAIKEYDPARGAEFGAFAKVCVKRKIFTALKSADANKHSPLNHAISITKPLFSDKADLRPFSTDPEAVIIGMEEKETRMKEFSDLLSAFEAKVLNLYLKGCSYEEMSDILGKEIKSVDNAIQRIRRKSAAFHW
jgi:RNA polymerase sporulation-specific sigma factor